MTKTSKREGRGTWPIGDTTLMGLGVGFIFLTKSVLIFIASLLIGIGLGLLVAALIPPNEG